MCEQNIDMLWNMQKCACLAGVLVRAAVDLRRGGVGVGVCGY